MPYLEIAPTHALRPWVECFWSRVDGADASGEHRVLPDGCADLVFDLTDGYGIAVGTMTRPLVVPARANGELFGVRFRPGRAAAFLRIPLAEITDARVALRELWSCDPADALASRGDRVALLEAELLRRLKPDRDARVDAAVARLVEGNERVETVAREIGISRQHLARQFLQHVGVPPKTFARVMRFRRVLESQRGDWADVAARHGYYDQSHLIADFRELAGATPGSFHFSNR